MADEKAKRSPEDRRAKMYDKSPEKPAEKKSTPEPEKKVEGAKEGEGGADAAGGYKDMMKRHEMERRDAHGAHKDNLRKIASRHEGEIKQFMDEKMGGTGGGQATDGAGGDTPSGNGGAMAEGAGE